MMQDTRHTVGRKAPRLAIAVLLVAGAVGAAAWATARTSIQPASLLYLFYIGVSLILGGIGATTLIWMMYAWRTPASLAESGLSGAEVEPVHSFSLIVPARHEWAVLETTLVRLANSDHPAFEVIVVVGEDDPGTRVVAESMADRHPGLVKVVVDPSWPKNKPKALNAALPHCTGAITGVFDAEDDVHPLLLKRVDQCFQGNDADIVQAGVQLMNFRSSWLTVHNVLEYYFWFRSRLHRHARQRFIPLGGNTVFIRTQVLRAVAGWDPDCLAEDCELGVRLSALGARTVVFYEPELVTREECPPTLRAFIRQRTRWNQGYLQTLSKGYWRRLPLRQRTLGAYILATPFAMAMAWLLLPVAIVTAVSLKAPVPITLISFLPTIPMICMLGADLVGLGEFCRAYGERPSLRDYGRLVLGLPLYQAVLTFAAARAVAREARGARGWEKTAHLGLHLAQPAGATGARRLELGAVRDVTARSLAGSHHSLQASSAVMIGTAVQGSDGDLCVPELPGWSGDGEAGKGHGDGRPPIRMTRARGSRPGAIRAAVPTLARSRVDVVVQVLLLVALGFVQWTNMLHWPAVLFDEGTYVGNAWAVGSRGELAFYTYTYGHPPLGWLLIALWTAAGRLFGHTIYSLDGARELMGVLSIISFSLLYTLARRLQMSPVFAAGAVVLFALSPLALFFHRGVLLDNPATVWVIAAFVLALSPRRRLWSFAGSGACFAASVLSKETTLVLLPALLFAAFQNTDPRTRRYCLTLLASFFVLLGLFFPLYATLKGELVPGPGHVSLIGTDMNMLFTRQGTGSIFNPHSVAHGTLTFWLSLDPWLLGAALLFSPIAAARRATRPITLAYLTQVMMILRPGYLPAMYVIALLPFAALIVAGGLEAVWRFATGRHPRREISAARGRLGAIGTRAANLLTPVAAVASALAMSAALAFAAIHVAPRWKQADLAALTLRLDAAERGAQRWLLQHVGREQRLIVTDDVWVYLIEHGFDSRPVKGGFNSPTVVSYWPLDKDPAVRQHFPYGWREFNYIVSNAAMRDTAVYTPSTAQALLHSRAVAVFGHGGQRIEIRAITPTPVAAVAAPPGKTLQFLIPRAGGAPSLNHVARSLGVSVEDIVATTNHYSDSPEWWYYAARHKFSSPLPRGTVLHYWKTR